LCNYDYEKNKKYDLHDLELDEDNFDFAMLNYTIEHLYDPIRAITNIYKYLKVGGMIYVSAPVVCVPHSTPYHFYTGFTPTGLGVIMKLAGFNILKIGQWGNMEYYRQEYVHLWSDYRYGLTPGLNDFKCPHATWCLAIKL
jgi:ubiquinone/menaquinone biosynthesis C-methylase UbiE